MLWWTATIVVWIVSAAWILTIMADVFRGKTSAFSRKAVPWYLFHGVTAILAIVFLFKALES